jgi:hypothetical protein
LLPLLAQTRPLPLPLLVRAAATIAAICPARCACGTAVPLTLRTGLLLISLLPLLLPAGLLLLHLLLRKGTMLDAVLPAAVPAAANSATPAGAMLAAAADGAVGAAALAMAGAAAAESTVLLP